MREEFDPSCLEFFGELSDGTQGGLERPRKLGKHNLSNRRDTKKGGQNGKLAKAFVAP